MATNNYSITFKSLRSETVYTLNIGGGSGTAIALKGGDQPFTTEENDDEDQFTPVRTQSGHIRIVDDGKDANENALSTDWWKDLAPINDTERPVTLTHVVSGSTIIDWQGFMQAQNFGGTLYGNPQEREFPVQCCLSVLAATQVTTTPGSNRLCNFAYLLQYLFNGVPSHSFTTFNFQGGAHAQQWLLKRLDWNNFLRESNDNDVEPQYNLYEILEDVCRFWGWTCRQHKTSIYFTCADDTAETTFLTLTPANLTTMANGTTAGTTSAGYSTTTISGDVFASMDNDDFKQRGAGKATVKADVNEQDTIVQFAPNTVRRQMEGTPARWTWVQGEEDLTGYFETFTIGSFTSDVLDGSSHPTRGGFCRRQIYSSTDADKPFNGDMFLINNAGWTQQEVIATPAISIVTKNAMAFGGGSLILDGDVYFNEKPCDITDDPMLYMGLGISPDGNRAHARWWYIYYNNQSQIVHGWEQTGGTHYYFAAGVSGGRIRSCKLPVSNVDFDAIPVDASLFGYVHVDFYSLLSGYVPIDAFQIANFSIKFSRDTIDIPTSLDVKRPRYLVEERVTEKEYTATNQNQTHEEWNADCIFASDNNMEYGYGLLMNADGSFMATAPYAAGNEHPEQHLANRVANYWAVSRRRLGGDFRANTIADISPQYKVTINGTTCHPVAVSHDWRDDVVKLSLLEMPS